MPLVTVSELAEADAQVVYARLSNMEAFPRFMKNVQTVRVRERGSGYTITEWTAILQGVTFRWVERDDWYPEQGRIAFRQLEGDLRRFEGYWEVRPGPRPGTCQVTLTTEFEFGMPMLAPLLNPVARLALKENARDMVRAVAQAAGGESAPS